jgi:hypothetical protein
MEITMGRPPIGKRAMSGAERVRRYRLKHGTDRPVTKPVTKPAIAGDAMAQELAQQAAVTLDAATATINTLKKMLALAEARIAELEKAGTVAAAEIAALKAELRALRNQEGQAKAGAEHIPYAELQAHIAALVQELEGSRKEVDNARRLIAAANDFLDRKARIVPHDMYQTLLRSTHPDRVTDPKAKARYEKAFVFLKEHEHTLAKRKPPPKPPPLPRQADRASVRGLAPRPPLGMPAPPQRRPPACSAAPEAVTLAAGG